MKKNLKVAIFVLGLLITNNIQLYSQKFADTSQLYQKLLKIKDISVKPIATAGFSTESYEIMFEQPLDHNNPAAGKFQQLIYLAHNGFDKPMVMITEGYTAYGNYPTELTNYLKSNQLIIEHRYFGKSVPEKMDYQYLTIEQAANDHHKIFEIFKQIYPKKWLCSGISKGGQTTCYYKYFFPNDADVAVPYVAPLNLAREEPRVYNFLNTVGTADCRLKLQNFQINLLKKRTEIKPFLEKYIKAKNLTFSIGVDSAYELAVFEVAFSFWQWGYLSCENIPDEQATADELFKAFLKVDAMSFFSDESMTEFRSFFYQAEREIGFYSYDISPFKPFLTEVFNPDFKIFAPDSIHLQYNPLLVHNVISWIQKHGNNFIFIYGANDPWSASGIDLIGQTNSLKIVKPGGFHTARIGNLPREQKQLVLKTLSNWMEVPIKTE